MTPDHQLVWEYISTYFGMNGKSNFVCRGYRVPYDWVPQIQPPAEKPVPVVDKSQFRVPGTEWVPEQRVTQVEGAKSKPSL